MTEYLTILEFDAYLTGDLKADADATQLQAALDRASAEADAYLRSGGYDTPVTSPTEDIKGRVADVALYRLAVTLRLLPEPAGESSAYRNYRDALEWFKTVASGGIDLDLPLAESGETPGAPVVATNTRRAWGDGW
jgi:phage gp36-like protein